MAHMGDVINQLLLSRGISSVIFNFMCFAKGRGDGVHPPPELKPSALFGEGNPAKTKANVLFCAILQISFNCFNNAKPKLNLI